MIRYGAIGKQLRWVGVAAALCFLALAIGGWWRSNRIEKEIASVQAQQADFVREAFPDTKIRGAVLHGRPQRAHGEWPTREDKTLEIEIPPSATMILREILAALPMDVRYQIRDIDIVRGTVDLTLLVKKSSDASIIANAIEARGFKVPSPKISRAEDNESLWTAPMNATWIGRATKPEVSG